jgi:hypothetical protein
VPANPKKLPLRRSPYNPDAEASASVGAFFVLNCRLMPIPRTTISSVEEFIEAIRNDSEGWPNPWFRGEPAEVSTPLLPRLYRPRINSTLHNENQLLQLFRIKAPVFAASACPDREATDQWLFLAQHVGLPTRLLDWTESALVGLYFALKYDEPTVWMVSPIGLNAMSVSVNKGPVSGGTEFPLTWYTPAEKDIINIGSANINGAWDSDVSGVRLPVAILPTHIHPRLSVQRSCFTVHGHNKRSLTEQVPTLLKRYDIKAGTLGGMRAGLRLLGISESTVWPDLDGLARELAELY